MQAATPPGAARPWRTKRSLHRISLLLLEEISEDDLIDHVRGCAQLIRSGAEAPQWWSVGNVFGPRTIDRWRAQIEAMREHERRIQERRTLETRREHERKAAATISNAPIDSGFAALADQAQQALRATWWKHDDAAAE